MIIIVFHGILMASPIDDITGRIKMFRPNIHNGILHHMMLDSKKGTTPPACSMSWGSFISYSIILMKVINEGKEMLFRPAGYNLSY